MPKSRYGPKAPFKMKSSPMGMIAPWQGGSNMPFSPGAGGMYGRRRGGRQGAAQMARRLMARNIGVPGRGSTGIGHNLWKRGGSGVGGWRTAGRRAIMGLGSGMSRMGGGTLGNIAKRVTRRY